MFLSNMSVAGLLMHRCLALNAAVMIATQRSSALLARRLTVQVQHEECPLTDWIQKSQR